MCKAMSTIQCIWTLSVIFLMLIYGAIADVLQNVALNKIAVQSSQNGTLGDASKAVDGNRDVSCLKAACTLTVEEADPWWRVDLQDVYRITGIMITHRNEYVDMLNGAEIWIGISREPTENVRSAVISNIPNGDTVYISYSVIEGRYVTVRLPGSKKVLSLCEVEVFHSDYAYSPNVALKGHATQSTTLSAFTDASKAIDGRRNSFYSYGFCSHTAENEADPWWRVDLQQTYTVATVKVTNRGDCCAERLDGAEIRIGNSLDNNGNNNPRCAFISHIRAGKTKTFLCEGGNMEGRFVNVIIPGTRKTLTLCEVEVYAAPAVEILSNVALKRTTAQSTTFDYVYTKSPNGVDGCKSPNYLDRSCTHTSGQQDPWWRVDLSAVHKVSAVAVTNRKDCCSDRLIGAEILIGNSLLNNGNTNPRCGTITSLDNRPVHLVHCPNMEGRYISVFIPAWRYLTVCEVEVYASLAASGVGSTPTAPPPLRPSPPTVNILLSDRNVTIIGERLCWSDALLYCRRHHWDLLSLQSQEEQSQVEQLLSRNPFPLTDHVWLGLRRYIMGGTWFWMSGDSMQFTKWSYNLAHHYYSSPCGAMVGGVSFLWEDQPCEESLNFICQSDPMTGSERVQYYSTFNNPGL